MTTKETYTLPTQYELGYLENELDKCIEILAVIRQANRRIGINQRYALLFGSLGFSKIARKYFEKSQCTRRAVRRLKQYFNNTVNEIQI